MNENFYNSRKMRPVNITGEISKNIIPHLVNLISPQMPVSQLNMGFNTTTLFPNPIYSLPLNPSFKEKTHPKVDGMIKAINYPVRLLINSELVGPLIGRKGEKIKEITAATGAKIDIKRESVPYSQWGSNQYMFSESGGARKPAENDPGRAESQIVFIVSERADKCSAAVAEILRLCCEEARESGKDAPALGLLAEDRFCARLIGRDGRFLNWVRGQSGAVVKVSNVPTITTLSEAPHVISLDRIISCRAANSAGGVAALLAAERLISDKIRQCVGEDGQYAGTPGTNNNPTTTHSISTTSHGTVPNTNVPIESVIPPVLSHRQFSPSSIIGSGIVHRANPSWPENLKLDENVYVRIPQICAGSIIGSEGKSVRRIMAETGTYIQISKTNLGPIESVPAVHTNRKLTNCFDNNNNNNSNATSNNIGCHGDSNSNNCNEVGSSGDPGQHHQLHERLITIKGPAPNQCAALTHIFSRVRVCFNQSSSLVSPLATDNNIANHLNNLQPPILNHHQNHNPNQNPNQQIRLCVVLRIPKLMLGRLIGKDGRVIRNLQMSSRTYLSFPRLVRKTPDTTIKTDQDPPAASQPIHSQETLHNPDSAIFGDADLHPVEIFGNYESIETALFMIRRLVYSSIFSQFGPALIPGPSSTSGHGLQNSHHPMITTGPMAHLSSLSHHHQPHQHQHPLIMPPPPPPPSVMLATGRRGTDCQNNVAPPPPPPPGPFFNGIPHGFHPSFVQSTMRMPHISRNFNRKSSNSNINNNNQRNRNDHRSQSDNKNKVEIDEIPDNKNAEDNLLFKKDGDISNSALETDCNTNMAGKRGGIIIKGQQDSSVIFTPENQFAQTGAHGSRDNLSPVFNQTSPCSFYTDRCPSNPNYLNMSGTEDLSFITAQESFSNMSDSFSDQNNRQHTHNTQQLSQSPSLQTSSPQHSQQQQRQQSSPPSPQQQQSFSKWSNNSNIS